MKSKKLCLILLAAALCGLLLTAKAEYSHSHWAYCTSPDTCAVCGETGVEMQWISHGNYSDQHDADGHWQACENCGEKYEYGGYNEHHALCTAPGVCVTCGAEGVNIAWVSHDGESKLMHDGTEHWCVCSACGEELQYSRGTHYSECTAPDTCVMCGGQDVTIAWTSHGDTEMHYDDTDHWEVCLRCGQTTYERTRHTASCSDPEKCNGCDARGVTMAYISHEAPVWKYNKQQHWQVCQRCGEKVGEPWEHNSNEAGDACQSCGAKRADGIDLIYVDPISGYRFSLRSDNTAVLTGNGYANHMSGVLSAVPATVAGCRVTEINSSWLFGAYPSSTLVIPEGVTRISGDSFWYVEGLKEAELPASLKSISTNAIPVAVTLVVDEGSYAHQFAVDQGRPYRVRGQQGQQQSGATTVKDKVKEVVATVITPGMSDYQKALTLHTWLITHANYDYTYSNYSASGVLLKGTGVCQSYTEAYGLLLDAVGIPNTKAYGSNHTWNVIQLNGAWCHVDCTWDDPGSGGGENYDFFGVTDAALQGVRAHENSSKKKTCDNYKAGYAYRNGKLQKLAEQWTAELLDHMNRREASITLTFEQPASDYGMNECMAAQLLQDTGVVLDGKTVPVQARFDMPDRGQDGYGGFTITVTPDYSALSAASVPGDVTGDGAVDIMDVIRLLKRVSGWDVQIAAENSDVTGDNDINIMDVIRLLKYVSGWNVSLG